MTTLVKLGGSVLTESGRPASFRAEVGERLAEEIASEYRVSGRTPIVVFGTGRAGKAYAKHYTGPGRSTDDWHAFQSTTHAIGELGMRLSDTLRAAGVPNVLLPANALFEREPDGDVRWENSDCVLRLRAHGVVPLIGGDVLVEGPRRFGIISSDVITTLAARLSPVTECVFVTDVDGVLDDDGRLIPVVDELAELTVGASDLADITGGMSAKVAEALDIARLNKQVMIVNGLVPGRLAAAMRGDRVTGTTVTSGVSSFPAADELESAPRCVHSDIT